MSHACAVISVGWNLPRHVSSVFDIERDKTTSTKVPQVRFGVLIVCGIYSNERDDDIPMKRTIDSEIAETE